MALWVRAVQLVNIAGMLCIVGLQTGYRIFSLPIIMSPQGKFIHQSYFWYMEKVFMYSYNKLCLEWSELFTCSKKLGESVSPSQGRNLSPLLCSWAGMWSPLGQHSASLLQLGPLHRVYPAHLCRLNCCLQLGDQTFSKDTGGHRSRKEICFISGQSRRCGINTESLSFKNL